MAEEAVAMGQDRSVVVVVGAESVARSEAARTFMADGNAVLLCPGPPACPLLRDDPCVLIENADAVVLIPGRARTRAVQTGLSMCAASAKCAVVVGDGAVWPDSAIRVAEDDIEGVARGFRRPAAS